MLLFQNDDYDRIKVMRATAILFHLHLRYKRLRVSVVNVETHYMQASSLVDIFY